MKKKLLIAVIPYLLLSMFQFRNKGYSVTGNINSGGFPSEEDSTLVRPIPPWFTSMDTFYKKYVEAEGVLVVGSDKVTDLALLKAKDVISEMLIDITDKKEILTILKKKNFRIVVMSRCEVISDLPEYSDIYTRQPHLSWNERRGVGATNKIPVTACGEENLLCRIDDLYLGENILVHEFAHSLHRLALVDTDPSFGYDLERAYQNAKDKGLFKNTYAISNVFEYFAEGVQTWFSVNMDVARADGVNNEINTREELARYDPTLYELLEKHFSKKGTIAKCYYQ